MTPVIPGFILVIPAKAGIHTDSPPEPYCPVSPWPCHPREGRDPPLALDSRLRGNDDLRAWERVVGVLRQPRRRESTLTHHQNHTARCPPGLVIPEKAEIHRWRWIPAFAGMTTSEHGNELLEFCDSLEGGNPH
ncbi:hypothetical protein [Endozoicomonas sp. 8E]|uniref:hypothetical protein n=1 Tax=Endozoicomonas sp. 8E TaxID=3035692 RepID=UPI002938E9B5|nr:hypothetical protein [Endozoicomonas sp. 8E]WOG25612.1 hypothetical protein P6910_13570 [Endozoicomonas sp. 8E]